jgi:hypothetical protein
MTSSAPSSDPIGNWNLAALPKGREEFARLIAKAFADAGFGKPQQLAAVANAIAESGLDPHAVSAPPERAVGLFQLNMHGGLGTGFTAEQLEDPATNVNIIISAAVKSDGFKQATYGRRRQIVCYPD